MSKKKIGIIGATGYTGSELMRILVHHDDVEVKLITSESRAGEKFSDVHPFFAGIADDVLYKADKVEEMDLDLLFLALPHGVSMDYVKRFKDKDFKIIDLSGDYRLSSPEVYEAWYNKKHVYTEGFEGSAYGLPELYREDIKTSDLIANPGCYPTSAILALAPLIKSNTISTDRIIVDSKSGTTGAGVKSKPVTHFSNVNDNFKAYGIKSHRHTIEIEETLSDLGNNAISVQFTPHLLPVDRGILTTAYAQPSNKMTDEELKHIYASFYKDEPFVRLCEQAPAIKDVRGSNYCNIFCTYDERTNNIIVISVIDNLVKGAAGQAVHNMNLVFGFDEEKGLNQVPVQP